MDMMKMTGFGLDVIGATVGERDLNTDDLISTKLLVLDFLRENIKEGNIEKRKERVYKFFEEAPNAQVPEDVCKPSVDFRKKFAPARGVLGVLTRALAESRSATTTQT